jgi:hypothetical protein
LKGLKKIIFQLAISGLFFCAVCLSSLFAESEALKLLKGQAGHSGSHEK